MAIPNGFDETHSFSNRELQDICHKTLLHRKKRTTVSSSALAHEVNRRAPDVAQNAAMMRPRYWRISGDKPITYFP